MFEAFKLSAFAFLFEAVHEIVDFSEIKALNEARSAALDLMSFLKMNTRKVRMNRRMQ